MVVLNHVQTQTSRMNGDPSMHFQAEQNGINPWGFRIEAMASTCIIVGSERCSEVFVNNQMKQLPSVWQSIPLLVQFLEGEGVWGPGFPFQLCYRIPL